MSMQVPFYPNHKDDMHCQMAVYASVLDYFLNQKLTYTQLENLVGFREGKAAWTVEALPKMARLGLDIKMVEPFDYPRYLKESNQYLAKLYSPEEIDWYNQHTNIKEMKKFIPGFLKTIKHEKRQAHLTDIDNMLKDGRLVFVTVNSRALNDKPGFASHAILVLDKNNEEYIVHDPGLPPKPFRHIKDDKLWLAMGGETNTAEVTGFKVAA